MVGVSYQKWPFKNKTNTNKNCALKIVGFCPVKVGIFLDVVGCPCLAAKGIYN